jgi:methyl-accepting chemotaxis protein
MFYTKKKEAALNAKLSNLTLSVQKIESMVRNSFNAIAEESKLNNTYIKELAKAVLDINTILTNVKETVSCIKTDVEDTFNRLDDTSKSITDLTAVINVQRMIDMAKFANELERLIKVVDILNDTIHENILDGATSLGDIT